MIGRDDAAASGREKRGDFVQNGRANSADADGLGSEKSGFKASDLRQIGDLTKSTLGNSDKLRLEASASGVSLGEI